MVVYRLMAVRRGYRQVRFKGGGEQWGWIVSVVTSTFCSKRMEAMGVGQEVV